MQLMLDENLSPDLVRTGQRRGYFTTSTRDLGRLGKKDFRVIPYCHDHDFVLVTPDLGDPRVLSARAGIHPGLIEFESEDDAGKTINFTLMEEMLESVITYIEEQAEIAGESPALFMMNKVVEVKLDGHCEHFDLPDLGEADQ